MHDHVARLSRPVSELVGVQVVELAPGETQEVTFEIDADDLAYRDADGVPCSDPGTVTVRIAPHAGGGSTASFELLG